MARTMLARLSEDEVTRAAHGQRQRQVRTAQVRLLYGNSATSIAVTIVAASALGYFEWPVVSHIAVAAWWAYMLLVSLARFMLTRRYWRTPRRVRDYAGWGTAYAVGAGLAAGGWGAAAVLLYPEAWLLNQILLVFILGGMMLGGASLLAPRPEAFLAFLIPTGLPPAIRLAFQGGEAHLSMGLLALVFTAATVTSTWRFFRAIESSLMLQFENQDLVEDLQIAKSQTEALNHELERRVEERTAELQLSTERLRAEIAQREQIEEELLRARNLKSLGVLAGGIAHDFNNFLTIVQGNIELARMKLHPAAPVQEILDETAGACARAAFLSSQLLTFAKGGTPIRRVASIAQLVSNAVKLARAGAPVSIDVQIAGDLWCAEVDPGQIFQALHNILLNARQAMPEGGIIEVRAENVLLGGGVQAGSGPHVRIAIQDYGSGISADVLPRIFDPYFTTKPGGSGLGLATAHAIVSNHGGRIAVESKPGEGSVFIVDLPAAQAAPAPQLPAGGSLQRGTGKLLVMDDEESMRSLLERVLTGLGYEVAGARDGAEAIALYEAAKDAGRAFDAALLDLTISGGMGGIETAARLKELDPSAKLIVSSGYSDAPVMSNFREYGFDDVIPKPWTTAQLSEVFRRVLVADPERKPN